MIENNRSVYPLLLLLLIGLCAEAQSSYNALFLGNSYTGYNNLPQMTSDLALSVGDTLTFDRHTPGGYRLLDHKFDTVSLNKIANGDWDFVVLQEQSRTPITYYQLFVHGCSFFYTYTKQHLPCAVMMPYMTWGRKNGDPVFCQDYPVMCTYEGMDTTIRNAYLHNSKLMFGEVSPVSIVWSTIRQNYPAIELYASDGSHPSLAGSYAAACCFYAAIFKKDPTFITDDYGLNPTEASQIRTAAKQVVFDQLNLWTFKQLPTPEIRFDLWGGINEVHFQTETVSVHRFYDWDFGDGFTSTLQNPVHTYATNGTFQVTLTTYNCDQYGYDSTSVDTTLMFCNHTPTVFHLGPLLCREDTLWTQPADDYQWYGHGSGLLPGEINQYLHYPDYPSNSSFLVRTTVNGCSEFSIVYTILPNRDFYYYHNFGLGVSWEPDPCAGDTAIIHVVPSDYNLTMHGLETIHWFRNGSLLPSWTGKDTLLITEGGTYAGWIADTTSACPKDTTFSMVVTYNCGTVGIPIVEEDTTIRLYPNPASDYLLLEWSDAIGQQHQLNIYSIEGILVKELEVVSPRTVVDIGDLSAGIYFVQLGDSRIGSGRFVKE